MSTKFSVESLPPHSAEGTMGVGEALDSLILVLKRELFRNLGRRGIKLTLPELQALRLLRRQPGMSLHCIVQETGRDKGQVTRKVKALEAKGLVRRERDSQDHRAFRLFLTEDGEAMERVFCEIRSSMDKRLFSPLSDKEGRQMTALLTKCLRSFLAEEDGSAGPRNECI